MYSIILNHLLITDTVVIFRTDFGVCLIKIVDDKKKENSGNIFFSWFWAKISLDTLKWVEEEWLGNYKINVEFTKM